jgi:hypothetical protein
MDVEKVMMSQLICWSVGQKSRQSGGQPVVGSYPPFPFSLGPFLCADLLLPSSQHPSQATLTHCLDALVGCVCSPLPSCVVSSNFKLSELFLSVFSHSFCTAPFTSNLGAPPGCLGGGARVIPSCIVALMICLTCVVDFFC